MTYVPPKTHFTGLSLSILSIVAMCLAFPPVARAVDHMQPGLWVITWTVDLPDVGTPPAPTRQVQCLSQNDVNADPLPKMSQGECQVSEVHRTWEKVAWKLDCGANGKGDGAIVYHGPIEYMGRIKLEASGKVALTRIHARRVGPC